MTDREELTIPVEREFADHFCATAMMVTDDRLAARAGPPHGTADFLRRQHDRTEFGIAVAANPEPAADIERVDADLVRRHSRAAAEAMDHQRHALRRCVDVVDASCCVIHSRAGFRFHRRARQAGHIDRKAGHMRGSAEGLVGLRLVAVFVFERQIARHVVVEQGRARRERSFGVDHDGKVLVIDQDGFCSFLGDGGGIGDHEGDFLPDEAHPLLGQYLTARIADHHAALARIANQLRRRLEARFLCIPARQNSQHARHRERSRDVDAFHPGMRPVGAQEVRMGLVRKPPVGRVLALAGHQPEVFPPSLEMRAHAVPDSLEERRDHRLVAAIQQAARAIRFPACIMAD